MKSPILYAIFCMSACHGAAGNHELAYTKHELFQIPFSRIPYQIVVDNELAFIVADQHLDTLLQEPRVFAREMINSAKNGILPAPKSLAKIYEKYLTAEGFNAGRTAAQIALLIHCRKSTVDVFTEHQHLRFNVDGKNSTIPIQDYSPGISLGIKQSPGEKLIIYSIEDALTELRRHPHIATLRLRGEIEAITQLERELFTMPDCDIVVKINKASESSFSDSLGCNTL